MQQRIITNWLVVSPILAKQNRTSRRIISRLDSLRFAAPVGGVAAREQEGREVKVKISEHRCFVM